MVGGKNEINQDAIALDMLVIAARPLEHPNPAPGPRSAVVKSEMVNVSRGSIRTVRPPRVAFAGGGQTLSACAAKSTMIKQVRGAAWFGNRVSPQSRTP